MDGIISKRILIVTALLLVVPISSAEAATISKCKQANGRYNFSDTGCGDTTLIERKTFARTQQKSHMGNTVQRKRTVGCTEAEKTLAMSHFNKAEEINSSYSNTNSYDYRKDKKRKYEHEMTVGRSILSACSGTNLPSNGDRKVRCDTTTDHMGDTSFGTTYCK